MSETAVRRKRLKVRDGDVFEMRMPGGKLAYGVAIVGGGSPYIIVLRTLHDSRPTLADLALDEIALVGWTMDALIYHGDWQIVGSGYTLRIDVPFPNFKVEVSGKFYATDFKGEILGLLKSNEVDLLDYKFSRSPIAFQTALSALHGCEAWNPNYTEIQAEHARRRMTRPVAGLSKQ